MIEVNIAIGISGAGKSTFFEIYDNTYKYICPDEVRKQMCGDVNDQSKNDKVFANCFKAITGAIRNRLNIIFDATNLSPRSLKEIFKIINENVDSDKYLEVAINVFCFEISRKPEVCKERCRKDIENGKDRADTSNVDGLHEKMSEKYINFVDSKSFKDILSVENEKDRVLVNLFKVDENGFPTISKI